MHIPTLVGLTAGTSLFVDNAPDYVRPYVIEHYARAQAVAVGQQIYRFPVTGKSSGGAFSILSTAAPASGDLGVSPHIHQRHHENFFCLKGGFQLWAYKEGENGNVTQARYFTPGDYASVPRNTTHTFQILSPDTELTGVISPGGFEDLFFFLADSNYTASTNSPYVPAPASTNSAGSGSSASILSTLERFDVYSQPSFIPRRDLVNGSAPTDSGWHTAANTIPDVDGIPYFVARDQGPMYLNGQYGWQIIQPFVTAATGGNFTQGSITMSRQQANITAPTWNLKNHTAFEVLEGSLSVSMSGQSATLVMGDVAFIPGGTAFSYQATSNFAKFMYVSSGVEGLDKNLMSAGSTWDYPVFPTYEA